MKIKIKLPVKVHVDNKVEIFISKNPTFKLKKKIDNIYNFILHYIKDKVFEI